MFSMKVTLFKNVIGEGRPSMELYPEKLLENMPDNVTGFTIRARRFPIVKQYFHKEFIYPFIAAGHQGDVNHISDHSYAGLLRFLDTKKTVITCHDLIPFEHPEVSRLGRLRYRYNIQFLPSAAKIIAVSNYTKERILRKFQYNPKDIKVVHNGVANHFKPFNNKSELRNKYGIRENTLLHVGTSFIRKNVEFILNLLSKTSDLSLVKVGKFTFNQREFIKENGIGNKIREFSYINDDTLVELYNCVDALIMPSKAEGFGLPVIEAMASGCPVICSDIPVFKELFNGGVKFIDTTNINESTSVINNLLLDTGLRNDLITQGLRLASSFSWEKCARETYQVYEELFK